MASITILQPTESLRPEPAHSPRRQAIGEIDVTRLYRAHVKAADWRGTEVTVFVEGGTREAAVRKNPGPLLRAWSAIPRSTEGAR